ncbi:MAG TPA: nucleotide exchange factor GrpE [Anaerolineae bacterium]|nr:nucleotide exchange factor GrpE [Anaerolineae bacterium]
MLKSKKDSNNDPAHEEGETIPEEEKLHPTDGTASDQDTETAEETQETTDEQAQLMAELNEARAEAQEYLDGWQRARAEFANYKKRVERENQDSYKRVTGDILSRYLNVIDDLELALKEQPQEGDAGAWAKGIELIYQKLLGMLETEGVKRIQAEGETFDPLLHEALSHEESSEHEDGQIIDVIRQGYKMDERVLRPALVRVAK